MLPTSDLSSVRVVDFARHALPALPLPGQRSSTGRRSLESLAAAPYTVDPPSFSRLLVALRLAIIHHCLCSQLIRIWRTIAPRTMCDAHVTQPNLLCSSPHLIGA
jgi:hypothetical protein